LPPSAGGISAISGSWLMRPPKKRAKSADKKRFIIPDLTFVPLYTIGR
jgi:hypothetical protein